LVGLINGLITVHGLVKGILFRPFRAKMMVGRQARWEKEKVNELGMSRVNECGMIYVYFTNTTDSGDNLRDWRLNER